MTNVSGEKSIGVIIDQNLAEAHFCDQINQIGHCEFNHVHFFHIIYDWNYAMYEILFKELSGFRKL